MKKNFERSKVSLCPISIHCLQACFFVLTFCLGHLKAQRQLQLLLQLPVAIAVDKKNLQKS